MKESDGFAFGAEAGLVIDELDSRGAAAIERRGDVVHRKTYVMDPRAPFGDEFADG